MCSLGSLKVYHGLINLKSRYGIYGILYYSLSFCASLSINADHSNFFVQHIYFYVVLFTVQTWCIGNMFHTFFFSLLYCNSCTIDLLEFFFHHAFCCMKHIPWLIFFSFSPCLGIIVIIVIVIIISLSSPYVCIFL